MSKNVSNDWKMAVRWREVVRREGRGCWQGEEREEGEDMEVVEEGEERKVVEEEEVWVRGEVSVAGFEREGLVRVRGRDGYTERVEVRGGRREGLALGEGGEGVAVYVGGSREVGWRWLGPHTALVLLPTHYLFLLRGEGGGRLWAVREGVAYRVDKVEWGCLEGVLVPGGEEGEGVAILPPVLPPYIQEWEGRDYGLLSLQNSLEEREEGGREREEGGREREEGGREITKEWMEEQMKRLRETIDWKRVIRTVRKLRYSGGVSTEPLHPPAPLLPGP